MAYDTNQAIKKINKIKETRESKLDLSSLQLETIPKELFTLTWLTMLNLEGNKIEVISDEIYKLTNIRHLNLSRNFVEELPKNFFQLVNLESLNLSYNKITKINSEINKLKNLNTVDLRGNRIKILDESLLDLAQVEKYNIASDFETKLGTIYLYGNPIEKPPLEVVNQGKASLKNYFKEINNTGEDILKEAKLLIVGEPGAGKTSLSKKIENEHYILNMNEQSTLGIRIVKYRFTANDDSSFQVNIWDFGGQEIYHATHQFFLTKRSLYILLSDSRAEDTDFNYWLQVIELLSDNSPVIIALNEKQDRSHGINEVALKSRFVNLKEIHKINLKSNRGLSELLNAIKYQIQQIDLVGTQLPKAWINIRAHLEKLSGELKFISLLEYYAICDKYGLVERDRAEYLSEFLHDIGVFLHFKDSLILKRWVILNPTWGTEAVYKILDNPKTKANFGHFTESDLGKIWIEASHSEMQVELLELMKKFELCYALEDEKKFIAPRLLPPEEPKYVWDERNNLIIKYQYAFLPKGLVSRFIVKAHRYILRQDWVWKDGVILKNEDSIAEIKEMYGKQEIRIRISGRGQKNFLTLITEKFDQIHDSYKHLKAEKMVPCNCVECKSLSEPYFFKYERLKKILSKGKKFDICENSIEQIDIDSLFEEVPMPSSKIKFFISYSHRDYLQKDKLLAQLSPLSRSGKIETWDDTKIKAGEEWNTVILENLNTADVIILLVSASFINSEYSLLIESSTVMQRYTNKKTYIVPVILSPCLWSDLWIGKLSALPFGAKPISQWDKEEDAYYDVVSRIKKVLDDWGIG